MADMTNIVDFNNSDGLPPGVVQKLNNNFWHTVSKIMSPDIVVASGASFPDPRTDETLFYNTITGDLYIWNEQGDSWGWTLIDIGYIHVDPLPPPMSQYQRVEEYLWICTSDEYGDHIYVWGINPFGGGVTQTWTALSNYVVAWIIYSIEHNGSVQGALYSWMSSPDKVSVNAWLNMPAFVDAVRSIS